MQDRNGFLARFFPWLVKPVEPEPDPPPEEHSDIVRCGCVVGRVSADGNLVPLESLIARQERLAR
jgi:hypothetical protein